MHVGLLIADEMEYKSLEPYLCKYAAKQAAFYNRQGHRFTIAENGRALCVQTLLCGTGKTNSAAGAMYCVQNGADILLNAGLSGSLTDLPAGGLVLGERYVEADVDLTPLGYAPGERPSQPSVFDADAALLSHYAGLRPCLRKGTFTCADRFVSERSLRESYAARWHAVACDMESAAAAAVCWLTHTPFLSIRRISDQADEGAAASYRAQNGGQDENLMALVFEGIEGFFSNPRLWPSASIENRRVLEME